MMSILQEDSPFSFLSSQESPVYLSVWHYYPRVKNDVQIFFYTSLIMELYF